MFFGAADFKNTFRKPVNIYNTVCVLIQHYYFQGQYYTCSFLELHILVLFLTSDRASCTVASSTLFTNTPKLQLLTLQSMSCHSKKKSNFNYPLMAFFTVLYALVFCRLALWFFHLLTITWNNRIWLQEYPFLQKVKKVQVHLRHI